MFRCFLLQYLWTFIEHNVSNNNVKTIAYYIEVVVKEKSKGEVEEYILGE